MPRLGGAQRGGHGCLLLFRLLALSLWPALAVGLRHGPPPAVLGLSAAEGREGCEALAEDHSLRLADAAALATPLQATPPRTLNCSLAAAESAVADQGAPTCSPYCGQRLDAVVVLGLAPEPLSSDAADRSRRIASALLEHFAIGGHAKGSLFGFVDVSHGLSSGSLFGDADRPRVVAELSGDRVSMLAALKAWSPRLGGPPVTADQLARLPEDPVLTKMLENSRADTSRTLLILGASQQSEAQSAALLNTSAALRMKVAHLQAFEASTSSGTNSFNWDVMESLLQVCPAVVLDPSMKCGRMRWGAKSE